MIDTKDIETGEPKKTSRLKMFKNCTHLIQYLPQLQADEKNPSDVATEPHYLTHIADALRYFCVNFTYPSEQPKDEEELYKERERERNLREYINYGVE